jgi:hypothetical protein
LTSHKAPRSFGIKGAKNMLSGHFLAHRPAFLNLLFNKDNFDFWFDKLMDNFVLVGLFPEVNVLAIFF